MPVHMGVDDQGHYYQYGEHGAKYYFNLSDAASQKDAMDKAERQGRAIHASQSRHKY